MAKRFRYVSRPRTRRRSARRWFSRPRFHRPKTIPILPTLGAANYLLQTATAGGKLSTLQSGDVAGYLNWALKDGIMYGTGYDIEAKTWDFGNFMLGGGTLIVSVLASKLLSKLGANRALAGIPLIGKKLRF